MRAGWIAAIVGVLVLTGCDAPTRPERTTRIVKLGAEAVAQANGDVAVRLTIEYPSDDGGPLRLSAPTLGTITDVKVDGSPRSAAGESVDIDPNERAATVEWIVHGAIERYADGAIVTLPLWTPPKDVNGDDQRVPVTALLQLPVPASGAVRWHGTSPSEVTVDGAFVRLRGEIATTTASSLTFLLPTDAVSGAPLLPGVSRVASFEDRQSSADAADARLAADLADDARREDLEANLYWGAVGLEIAIPFLITLLVLLRTAGVRRRALRDVPDELPDAPSDLAPAVVALLHADGQDIGDDAVAATILDLARRKALTIEGLSGERYKLALVGSATRPGEAALLAALGADREGPPLGVSRQGEWWRALRRDVVAIAREAGLLRRRYPSGLFLAAVMALAITTIPLYARSPEALVAGFVVATILAAIPFVGGFVLTATGHRERARWEAYRRHLASADLGDVPAAGVIVWESALVYAAALGLATAATKDLS